MKAGLDVLLVHPRLVQTGLDLDDFPTLVWQEVEYSVYTMRQASRRSWRIGQRRPVRVVYLAYRGTLQAQALTLVAKKLKASLAVEGELGDDGLVTFGDDGEDLLMALARSLTERLGVNDESLERLFAEVRNSERDGDAPLDDDERAFRVVDASARLVPSVREADEPLSQFRPSAQPEAAEDVRFDEIEPTGHQLRLF